MPAPRSRVTRSQRADRGLAAAQVRVRRHPAVPSLAKVIAVGSGTLIPDARTVQTPVAVLQELTRPPATGLPP
jgi:hypothetical protein